MPYLKDNQFPGASQKPGQRSMPNQHPSKKQDESLFAGRSQVSRYEFLHDLEKNKNIREELAKELKLNPHSPEMEAEIKDLEHRVPEIFGGQISKQEAQTLKKRQYWDQIHERQKVSEDGITPQESKQIARSKIKDNFLKRWFGIT